MFSLIPLPWRIAGGLLILAAAIAIPYRMGYTSAADKYQAKIDAYIAQKKELEFSLEEALANIKEVVVTKYVDKVKVVKEKEYVYVDQIKVVPSRCELSDGWVYLHDSSARGEDATTSGVADETPSGIRDTQALERIVKNYGICERNSEQLIALQEYVRMAEEAVRIANEKNKKKK